MYLLLDLKEIYLCLDHRCLFIFLNLAHTQVFDGSKVLYNPEADETLIVGIPVLLN